MIKIITGYSAEGGSTIALTNLAKEFNNRSIQCEVYGPHDWHLTKGKFCKKINELVVKPEDKFIIHFCDLGDNLKGHKVIFSCHELWWFDFKQISKCYDKVQFLNERQASHHSTIKNYVIIPNVKEYIKLSRPDSVKNVAGVIGRVEDRKNTEASIKRALADGCEKVLIFGPIGDIAYFNNKINNLLSDKVVYLGYKPKEEIYSMIDRVYHMSKGEVASLVKDECFATGTLFFGNEETSNQVSNLTNDEVISIWKKELDL